MKLRVLPLTALAIATLFTPVGPSAPSTIASAAHADRESASAVRRLFNIQLPAGPGYTVALEAQDSVRRTDGGNPYHTTSVFVSIRQRSGAHRLIGAALFTSPRVFVRIVRCADA